jgi:hypothetical protein
MQIYLCCGVNKLENNPARQRFAPKELVITTKGWTEGIWVLPRRRVRPKIESGIYLAIRVHPTKILLNLNYYPSTLNKSTVRTCRPTVCVTGAGADVDSVWEQKKPEARKLLENRAESHLSAARFVGHTRRIQDAMVIKSQLTHT